MRKVPLLVAVLFSLGMASSALAAGYGAAGCGPGSVTVNQKNKMGHQILASFQNNPIIQMSAISSGTSNCGSSGLVLAKNEQKVFVEKNFDNIAKEMAVGEGEHIDILAGLLGCSSGQSSKFSAFSKEHYGEIFKRTETSSAEMLISLKSAMAKDQRLGASCHEV